MIIANRRKFSSAFKSQVAFKEKETLSELSQRFEVSQEIITRWNGEFLSSLKVFLLARSRHVVMTHFSKWTSSQKIRAEILFEKYPKLKEAYDVSMKLTQIYNTNKDKGVALTKLALWYNSVEKLECKFFNSVIQTMQNNYGTILNYFDRKSTNAAAESFNAKVKAFRAQFRGVRDIPFFIFRLNKILG